MPRADDIATIAEHNTTLLGLPDDSILRRVFRTFGWDAFTDEAIAEFAEWHVWRAEERERRNDENRAIHAAAEAERKREAA